MEHREAILILDFGSQYTQLIARRVREARVYSEILPFNADWSEIESRRPKGIILSGGPESVLDEGSPRPDPRIYDYPAPLLGICYGLQLLAQQYGAIVEPGSRREFGRAEVAVLDDGKLLRDVSRETQVWMSHGDHVTDPPTGFRVTGRSDGTIAAIEDRARRRYGIQFHPEVVHTVQGRVVLSNFLFNVCGCGGDWTPASFAEESVAEIRARVGPKNVVCGLSGGVDSTVAACLVNQAIGDRLHCIFVDNGLLRKNEFRKVLRSFREQMHLDVTGVDASRRFLDALAGVEDPEEKRRIIGEEFIRVFEGEADRLGDIEFLVQGTLYPDVIESVSVRGPSAVIKSHHNVGGLPDRMRLTLIEPLRELFKDEVRQVGRELDVPDEFVDRQPFPGPGLAVRILGDITESRLAILQDADEIVVDEIRRAGLYRQLWQSFGVLLPIKSVGVMGDDRTYENVVAVRAVNSQDGMTADWAPLPNDVLARISSRIVNEVPGVNRVVYDITSKPPGTIEWE